MNLKLADELLDVFKVKTARFELCVKEEDFILRQYSWKDLIVLRSLFSPEIFLSANGVERKAFGSLFSFYRWMNVTFRVFYVCEIGEEQGHRIIGFIGVYNLEAGRTLYLSIAIFNRENRGRGYGTRALKLLLSSIRRNGTVEKVCVEILGTNIASLSFFKKLGFEVFGQSGERLLLSKNLATPIQI